jgi:hypothetical protein
MTQSGLDKGEKPFVLLRMTEEFERNATHTDGANHGGDFERRLILHNDNFQIKNVVYPHQRLALDNTPTQRKIQHRALASDFSPGKGEVESYRDTEMFPTVDCLTRSGYSQVAREKSVLTVLALERSDPRQYGHQFSW